MVSSNFVSTFFLVGVNLWSFFWHHSYLLKNKLLSFKFVKAHCFNCLWADSYAFAIWGIYLGEEFQWFVSKFWVWYSASAYWTHHISGSDKRIECWIIHQVDMLHRPYLLMSCAFLLYSSVIWFFSSSSFWLYPHTSYSYFLPPRVSNAVVTFFGFIRYYNFLFLTCSFEVCILCVNFQFLTAFPLPTASFHFQSEFHSQVSFSRNACDDPMQINPFTPMVCRTH